MTAAYHEAEGDGHSRELTALRLIERFGVKAVLGRDTLSAGEIARMITAENIYKAKQANDKSENWAEWARNNPHAAKLLAETMKLLEAE